MTKIIGIVNITKDSFSDGGNYLNPESAIEKSLSLIKDGADMLDLGAESTHPDSESITPELEIQRLTPVIEKLKQHQIPIAIDTYRPKVIEHGLKLGVDMINDVTALDNPKSVEVLQNSNVPIVIMYSRNLRPHADKTVWESENYIGEIIQYFEQKINNLVKRGIDQNRLILDPGMGFFIGSNPEPSLNVLKHCSKLKELGNQIYISTSRKSFIGTILNKPVHEREIGTLTTEIWAYLQKVDYIRTHNVHFLFQGTTMLQAIERS